MNTNDTLKQLKEKLDSLEEILKSEHDRLTEIHKGIEFIENNKHILLDEQSKQVHLNTIKMYNEQVNLYNLYIIEYEKIRKEYNLRVKIQEILVGHKF